MSFSIQQKAIRGLPDFAAPRVSRSRAGLAIAGGLFLQASFAREQSLRARAHGKWQKLRAAYGASVR
jgi:hypothetical protein